VVRQHEHFRIGSASQIVARAARRIAAYLALQQHWSRTAGAEAASTALTAAEKELASQAGLHRPDFRPVPPSSTQA